MRSFIAIELPEAAKSVLSELQDKLISCRADIRWVKPASMHLTLKFLGNIEEEIVESIIKIVEGTSNKFKPFAVAIKGLGVFPSMKSPRVLWAGLVDNGSLSNLQQEIEAGMTSLGFQQEGRKFAPHLTLGRFRSLRGKTALLDTIALLKDHEFSVIPVKCISLMRSDLSPAGAKYTKLAEFVLGRNSENH